MSEEKRRAGRPKGSKDKQPRSNIDQLREKRGGYFGRLADIPVNAESNGQYIRFLLKVMPDKQLDLRKEESIEEGYRRLRNYLEACEEFGVKIGNQQMYMALGVSKQDVWNWVNGIYGKSNPGMVDLLKICQSICSSSREKMMAENEIPTIAGIFWQKNYDGMRDQQELVVQTHDPLGDLPQERLAEKYADSVKSLEAAQKEPL